METIFPTWITPGMLIGVALWTFPWKAWALWLAARRGEIWWFLAILFLNTLAILDIIYIFLVAKQQDKKEQPSGITNAE